MTVAASLAITARAAGFIARTKVMFARPVVEIGGIVHEFNWLTTHRFVMRPGPQRITVYFKRKESTGAHATTTIDVLPGETVHLVATLEGKGRFSLKMRRDRMDPRTADRAV
ncbi:MAG TPA: hypothetical protein GX743_03620 [Actinomycetales bacterium]|nr:hypothetical protein [Actinomycetales bacterium]